jgi:hypothetical protein
MRYSLTTAFISRNKLSPEVHISLYIFASAVVATDTPKREFSLPFSLSPSIGRHFCRHCAGPEVPTFSTRSKCHPCAQALALLFSPPPPLLHFSTTTTQTSSTTHPTNSSLPEQQLWLPPPTRPAFGHLKGSHRTTAPTASDRVISQIASIRKNKDTLNSKPPPSLGSNSGS